MSWIASCTSDLDAVERSVWVLGNLVRDIPRKKLGGVVSYSGIVLCMLLKSSSAGKHEERTLLQESCRYGPAYMPRHQVRGHSALFCWVVLFYFYFC